MSDCTREKKRAVTGSRAGSKPGPMEGAKKKTLRVDSS